MALISGAVVGILASIAVTEGIMAILEQVVGNPEADVQAALQSLASKNQRRAFALESGETQGIEEIDRKFARFNSIPRRTLTQAAITGGSPLEIQAGTPQNTGVLDFVASRLGTTADGLRSASAPRRTGDLSGVFRSAGKPPPANQ